jgi:hypothetical protein
MSTTVYIPEPRTCDVCTYELGKPDEQAQYDARTLDGRWANVCEAHFRSHTPGRLGTGQAQRLIVGERPPRVRKTEADRAAERAERDVALEGTWHPVPRGLGFL